MDYVKGDLFKHIPENKRIFIVHVVNNLGEMGSGFAYHLVKHFPEAKKKYVQDITNIKKCDADPLGVNSIYWHNGLYLAIVHMIAQHSHIRHGEEHPLRYHALVKCMDRVANLCLIKPDTEIYCPKFGSGLARGNWEVIEKLIKEIWTDRGIKVTVFEYE